MRAITELRKAANPDPEEFDWYGCSHEKAKRKLSNIDISEKEEGYIYQKLIKLAKIVFVIALFLRFVTFFTHTENVKVGGKNVKNVLNYILLSIGFLLSLNLLLKTIKTFVILEWVQKKLELHGTTIRYLITMFWLIMMELYRSSVKHHNSIYYRIFSNTLKALLLLNVFLIVSHILLGKFQRVFIKKSLKAKLKEITHIENTIKALKKFIFENDTTDRSNSTSSFINLPAQCLNFCNEITDYTNSHNILIDEPELPTLTAACTLAKDSFTKAAEEQNELDFEAFAKMFKNPQVALRAFAYFDSDQDRTISKKEFKDTLVGFYYNRKDLEKSYKAVQSFVQIMKRIWYIFMGILLSIPILFFYGVHIAKILTVLGSSAVILELGAGKLLMVFPKSIIFLLNHQYDIGDEILMDEELYRVHKIGLLSTTFVTKMGGVFRIMNSEMWATKIVNMTRAPENKLLFTFDVEPEISMDRVKELNEKMHKYLINKIYDYHDNFTIQNQKIVKTGIDLLHFVITLKCKGYKNMSKKFVMRMEFTGWLKKTLKELEFKEVKN